VNHLFTPWESLQPRRWLPQSCSSTLYEKRETCRIERKTPLENMLFLKMEEQQQALKSQSYKPRTTLGELNFTRTKSRFAETSYPLLTRSPIIHKISASDDEEEEEAWKWVLTFVITTGFMCCLTVDSFKNQTKWGLEIWKWCLLVMVVISGRMFSGWVVRIIVFFVERNYMLREKVLYFVYGLRKSFQNCILKNNEIFKKVFRALIGVLVGAIIWLTKIKYEEKVSKTGGPKKIDIERLRKLSRENTASAWSIPRLVNYVMYSGLSRGRLIIAGVRKLRARRKQELLRRGCSRMLPNLMPSPYYASNFCS
ncbi:hypothetical protein C5167_049438, partial [Papaver somniferum]